MVATPHETVHTVADTLHGELYAVGGQPVVTQPLVDGASGAAEGSPKVWSESTASRSAERTRAGRMRPRPVCGYQATESRPSMAHTSSPLTDTGW